MWCGGNQLLPVPPATFRKAFHIVVVPGCVSHNCKLDLDTVQDNPNGPRYQKDILETVVVPHFDSHALTTRPVFMDNNARPPLNACSDGFPTDKKKSLPFLGRC